MATASAPSANQLGAYVAALTAPLTFVTYAFNVLSTGSPRGDVAA